MKISLTTVLTAAVCFSAVSSFAADLVKAKDPKDLKRYEGSVLIAHQKPKYEEYYTPRDDERSFGKVNAYTGKSEKYEGHVERWTYLVPDTQRTSLEVFVNYRDEFKRLGLETVYAPNSDDDGWYGPAFDHYAERNRLGQILAYNEEDERYLIVKTKDAEPTYYVLFVTAYKDGIIPDTLENHVKKQMPLVQLDIISPSVMEEKMVFVKAEEMQNSIQKSGHIALYGLYFDTDKDVLKSESEPSLVEIAKLLKNSPDLNIYVVGHTDNQGTAEYNLNLSQRRAASIVKALTSDYGIAKSRLVPHGVGLFSPVSSNSSEDGRSKNRRVELVEQ